MTKKYGVRVVNKDGTSHGGFKNSLVVGDRIEAPDWNPKPECGGGIHFWPNGQYYNGKNINDPMLIWMLVSYETSVEIESGKHKAPWVIVEKVGNQAEIMCAVHELCSNSGSSSNSGNYGSSSNSGNYGSSSNSGNYGSSSNSGDCGSSSNSGDCGSSSNSGYYGSSSNSGYYGSSSNSGYRGSSSNYGNNGIASSTGISSKAYATHGIACATGEGSIVAGKKNVLLVIKDNNNHCSQIVDGINIKEDTWYCLLGDKLKEIK